ncbi:MAG: zinc ribbon domain-containing protein [Candidatus Wukongarchaeota archaeon]|nr:zinc ribbon domain-containing protein [Candidatus Wukongarchaeota archaeon]
MAFLSFLGRRVISLEGEYIGVVTDLERNPLTGDSSVVIRVEVPDSQVEFLKLVPKDFRVEEDFLRLKRRVKILKRGSSVPKVVGSVPTVPEFPKKEQPKKIERPLPTTIPEPVLPTIPEVSKEEQPKKIERPLPTTIPEIPKPSLDLPSVDLLSDVLPEERDFRDLKEGKKELKSLASREPEPPKPSVDLLSDVLPEERFRSLEKDKKGLRPLASREKPLVESSERGSMALTESYGLGRKKDRGNVGEKALTDFPFSPTVDSNKEKLCKNCGKSVSSEFVFCPFCASPLNVCKKCGKDLDPDWVACPFCGTVVKNY